MVTKRCDVGWCANTAYAVVRRSWMLGNDPRLYLCHACWLPYWLNMWRMECP